MKKTLLTVLKSVISLGLLGYLLGRFDLMKVVAELDGAHPGLLALAGVIGIAYVPTLCFRWRTLLTAAGLNVAWLKVLYFQTIGFFYDTCIPGSVAGEVFRAEASRNQGLSRTAAYSIVFLDRLIGLVTSALLVACALLAGHTTMWSTDLMVYLIAYLGFVSAVVLSLAARKWIIRFPRWLPEKMRKIYGRFDESLSLFSNQGKGATLTAAGAGLVGHLLLILRVYVLMHAVGQSVPFEYVLFSVPLIGALGLIPLTVGGVGLREVGYIFFFTRIGVPEETAILVSLLYFLITLGIACIGGSWQIVGFATSDESERPTVVPSSIQTAAAANHK